MGTNTNNTRWKSVSSPDRIYGENVVLADGRALLLGTRSGGPGQECVTLLTVFLGRRFGEIPPSLLVVGLETTGVREGRSDDWCAVEKLRPTRCPQRR